MVARSGSRGRLERRVAITGIGLATPLGATTALTWSRLCERPAPVPAGPVCAPVPDFDPVRAIPDRKLIKVLLRGAQLGIAAALSAVEDTGLELAARVPERMGVFTGCGSNGNGIDEIAAALRSSLGADGRFSPQLFAERGAPLVDPMMLLRNLPNAAFAHISRLCRARGANQNFMTGAVAGSQAVTSAMRALAAGTIDVAVAGGFESLPPLGAAPAALPRGVTAARSCVPYDRQSSGTFLGEGAAMLVLEHERHALERGARVLAWIGSSAGATDLAVDRESSEAGLLQVMRMALDRARCRAADVGCVVGSASGDPAYDRVEIGAVQRAWAGGGRPILTSLRGSIGSVGPGGGPLALAIAARALSEGVWPAGRRIQHRFPDDDFDHLDDGPRHFEARQAMVVDRDGFGRSVAFVLGRP